MSDISSNFFDCGDSPEVLPEDKPTVPKPKSKVDETALSFFSESPSFDFDAEKQRVINDLDFLKSLTVQEFTFFKKYEELQSPYVDELQTNSSRVKATIWSPTDLNNEELTISEIEQLEPELQLVMTPEENSLWTSLRIYCHSANYEQVPGRYMKVIIRDKATYKCLGFVAVGSEIIASQGRDEYIGWTKTDREGGKLANSAVGSTIAPTQPLGYNFLGGKLIAGLVTTSTIRDAWKEMYGDTLVGMTTTSLYGRFSQYTRLPYFRAVGKTKGKILIKPGEKYYKIWHDWLKQNRYEEYNKMMTQKEGVSGPVTGAKLRVLDMICNTVGIKQSNYQHGFERGIYYSCFYENTREFLRGEIENTELKMKPMFEADIDGVMDWWKPRAIKR